MGILDKISKKVGDVIETYSAKNMTGATKEEYVKDKSANAEAAANAEASAVKSISGSYQKADLDNLDILLKNIGAIDDEGLWIGGFLKLGANRNAVFANILSSKKNLKFLTYNAGVFYLIRLDNEKIMSYKGFRKKDVVSVSSKSSLFEKTFKVELIDRTTFIIGVAANKGKINQIKSKLK